MKISASAVLTLASTALTAIQDFQAVAAAAAPGLSAADLATVQQAQANLQAACSADFAKTDAELAAAEQPPA